MLFFVGMCGNGGVICYLYFEPCCNSGSLCVHFSAQTLDFVAL